MKKRLFAASMAFGLAIVLASCGGDNQTQSGDVKTTTDLDKTTTETKTNSGSYTIEVYDLDGELVGNETLSIDEYPSLWEGLNAKFDVKADEDSHWLTSINQTVVDKSWSLMIYENDALASTGVDGIVVDNGDKFTFKNECWNTVEFGYAMDSYDVLVDNAIYAYAKNKLQNKLATYSDISFIPYELLGIHMMESNNYDKNLFNIASLSEAYKNKIHNKNVSELQGADFAKWYFGARATKEELDDFKVSYTTYLESLTTYGMYDEYTLPFTLTFALSLGLDDKIKAEVKNTTYRASLEYGPDGLAWQLTGLAMYNTFEASTLTSSFTKEVLDKSFGADVSLALMLMAYAANNYNVRDYDFYESKDIIEYLFDNYYDKETKNFTIEKNDGDISSSQIYAALMAYKIQRDQKKAVNIFA